MGVNDYLPSPLAMRVEELVKAMTAHSAPSDGVQIDIVPKHPNITRTMAIETDIGNTWHFTVVKAENGYVIQGVRSRQDGGRDEPQTRRLWVVPDGGGISVGEQIQAIITTGKFE